MKQFLLLFLGLAMTATAGVLAAAAFSQGTAEPTKTVTINVATGPTGPPGPKGEKGDPGPAGPAGGLVCPEGFSPGDLVINHPGGQVTLFSCLKD